jgi:type IV pilus assembly protein PilA
MKISNQKSNRSRSRKVIARNGFTMTEIIIAATIIGILTTIATPNYLKSLRFAKQKEAEIVISTILTSISSFEEEYGRIPKGWDDLDRTQPLRTATGIASGASYSQVQLPGENYSLKGSINANTVVLEADSSNNWNVVGCINISNGLSAIKKGPITNNNQQEAKQTIDAAKYCPV